MNDFKDKQVIISRLYLFAAPLILIIGYIVSLLFTLTGSDYEIQTEFTNPIVNNIVGSLAAGYLLSCEITIIFLFVQLIRKNKGAVKILLAVFLVPAMAIGIFPSMVATIPYYVYSYTKTKKIAIDKEPVISKKKFICLFCMIIVAIVVSVISIIS